MIPGSDSPTIICLCGSTRFFQNFQQANYEFTMQGKIVLSVGFYPHAQKEMHHSEDVGCTPEQKLALDNLHLRKIDLAQEVHFLNVDGYIGSSTRRELAYSLCTGKRITFLEPGNGNKYIEDNARELAALGSSLVKEMSE